MKLDMLKPGLYKNLGKAIITERVLTFITRIFDALMIYLIARFGLPGLLYSFFGVGFFYLVFIVSIIYTREFYLRTGTDLTGIEDIKNYAKINNSLLAKALRVTLKSEKLIFWIGSIFYLDSDYVTLILYKREKGFWWNILNITTPSVCLSMFFWTMLYYLGYLGFEFANNLLNFF